ncbi:50S ribosomal protein L25/general stress protein Ctc [Kaustia mangrovi]|uniref:Large ribosomal subunit protein bL25 n=1 Tax=Kaustia mangrovi TaxID=2593653 RepID=A0A7S8C6K8_9HYPH|nr:50S ribosomal protein L25/general stress protein Ctc [Kaustia mangrovi]QPC44287.1 50S ribosomal protein L25/general stress protein Ctc [Kaustia mangrovi]
MAQTTELTAVVRERGGKGAARALRRQGLIPAVIYGDKKEPELITLNYREVLKEVETGRFLSHIYNVKVGGKAVRVIPRDVQFEPVRDFIVHIDFLRLAKGATIAVAVPVNFVNEEESPGLKRGGVLNIVRHEVELECPNDAIPEELVADLTGLDIGDSIHISAIPLPEGVTPTITDRDFTVATVAAPAVLTEAEEAGEEVEEAEAEEAEAEEDGGEAAEEE